jgi:hypothetical protein
MRPEAQDAIDRVTSALPVGQLVFYIVDAESNPLE